jgi:hypothetical protein
MSLIYAETITIINDNPNSKIYLNGQLVSEWVARDIEVLPGKHHIKIFLEGEKIYSRYIIIKPRDRITVDTSHTADLSSKELLLSTELNKIESKKARKSKGRMGIGGQYHFNGISGISTKLFILPKLAIQPIGWIWDNTDWENKQLKIRVLYSIKDKLLFRNALFSFYTGIGYGLIEKKRRRAAPSGGSDDLYYATNKIKDTLFEGILGVEIPFFRLGYFCIEGNILRTNSTTIFRTFHPDESTQSWDMGFSVGYHFYF